MRRIIYCVAGQGGPHLSVGQYISHPPITFSISDCFPYTQPLDIPKDRGAYSVHISDRFGDGAAT